MSRSRSQMLERIQKLPHKGLVAPELIKDGITYENPLQTFAEIVPLVGGTALIIDDGVSLQSAITTAYPDAEQTCVWPSTLAKGNVDLETLERPHELEKLDLMVCKGHFGVAENGAVWIKLPDLRYRVSLIICEHLALVINKKDILNNMHEAYERPEVSFDQSGYGIFLSGPSKTADIEQCLVIGAHGPKSCTIFLV
jgi:L-lactate dehydrogenase complex protein LldG